MRARTLLGTIPALALLALAGPAGAASSTAVSENWAGYAAAAKSAGGFSDVSGDWTSPAATCTSGRSTYSAFWVGLGGASSQSSALEQAGTQADCNAAGKASYHAWYELVPSAPVKLALKVAAGDSIATRVAVSGDQVTITVDDQTTGQSVTKTVTMTAATPDTSTAEWMAEAPSECASGNLTQCSTLPLTDFGTVRFTHASATAGGHTGSISDPAWTSQSIALSSASGSSFGGGGFGAQETAYQLGSSASAIPSALSSKGSAFKVTYARSGSSSGASSSAGTGYPGYGGYPGDGGGYPGYGYGGGFPGYGYGGYGGGYPGYGYGGGPY
jgi:hypothetical protein